MTDTLSPPVFAALAIHHTATSDAAWDGPAQQKNLDNDDGADEYRKAYAWVDPDADPDTKSAYGFVHHFVNSDGQVGAASTVACSSTVAILNGGRGVDVKAQPWFSARDGIYAHVAAHLKDSGVDDDDIPELDDMAVVEQRLAAHRAKALAAMAADLKPKDVPMAAVHKPFTGRHTHAHSCFGKQGSTGDESVETTHTHSHAHNGDADHSTHSHPQSVADPQAGFKIRLGAKPDSPFAGMGERARRKADAANEVTDPEQLASMVAAGLAERGASLTAATRADGTITGSAWHAYLCPEGIRTDDGRELLAGACQFPDLPVSLRLLIEDEGGHWGAVTCGRIDSMARKTDQTPTVIYSDGVFGTDPNGQLAELMVTEQTQRFISIDPRDVEGEWVSVVIATGDGDWDDDVFVDEWLRISSCVIGAATIVPMPAYPQAVITLGSVDLPDAPIANASAPPSITLPVGIAAAGGPLRPKKAWFDNPGFTDGDERLVLQEDGRSYACPMTVCADGQFFGHVAWWECAHTGFAGRKVTPPHSKTGYAFYLTGAGVECEDGTVVEGVGQITMGTGHAPTGYSYSEAVAHYDGGYGAVQVADVRCGEDAYGIWVAGALRPNLTDLQVREFRALSLSGDWRDRGGNLEMMAVLAVPVPGFPVRRALAASGSAEIVDFCAVREGIRGERVMSLVAAGRVQPVSPERRIWRLEREMEAMQAQLRQMAIASMRAGMAA